MTRHHVRGAFYGALFALAFACIANGVTAGLAAEYTGEMALRQHIMEQEK